jgi:hypothetical protein
MGKTKKSAETAQLGIGDVSNSTSNQEMIDKRFQAVEYWAKLVYDGEIDLRAALLGMSYVAQTNFS